MKKLFYIILLLTVSCKTLGSEKVSNDDLSQMFAGFEIIEAEENFLKLKKKVLQLVDIMK